MDGSDPNARAARILETLEGLLALDAIRLDDAMTRAAHRISEVLGADKVDVLLLDDAAQCLVAVGTSDTPMGRREHELGWNRLPLAGGGHTVAVFQRGGSRLTRDTHREPGEPPGLVEDLGVRSAVNVALDVAGERRGVLLVCSATPNFFTERDRRFLQTVARWIGLVSYRLAHAEQVAAQPADGAVADAGFIDVLTPRQRAVAALVAEGLTNAEIARRLVVTTGTAANHVEAIRKRLGFTSRVQVATWATRHGLVDHASAGAGRYASRAWRGSGSPSSGSA